MKLLEGKVALITGAARGIGKAIAVKFAEEGANVAFTDLNYDDNMKATETELNAFGVKARGYASNAASFEDSEKLIEDVANDFERIDILVNNAGITRDNLLMRMQEQDWDMVMTVNLKSVFNLTKAVQRVMMKQRYGSIINMSSVVGVEGNAGQSNYSASKAGMIGFTKSIAQELGSRNIRCNAIAPGFIETEMTHQLKEDVRDAWIKTIPLRRSGKPEDVADVAAYLASDMSSYVTGQVINVCGGMST
jgi:3-oxoacyl-[acyl-carrier protein] reductase